MAKVKIQRRYPIGAELISKKGVHFRVWAPDHKKVSVVLEKKNKEPLIFPLKAERNGYHSLLVPEAHAGDLYYFKVGDDSQWLADPASRYQHIGPMGPSMVLDPSFPWTDQAWEGVTMQNQIIYEIHIGTFTQEGTYKAATEQLPILASLGITIIELMPLNDFPGHFGWGYDGVNLYAPSHLYGQPYELKEFIDKAHKLGLGVILDVVYNHIGPAGNQLTKFTKDYFTDRYETDWGAAINYDCDPVREFVLTNIRYWIEEYHFDGFRVDATSCMYCSTPIHILAELTKAAKGASKKNVVVIGENEPQDTKMLRSYDVSGYEFDGLWNDDFHHTARVRLTGKREAYYTDYLGSPQEFISAIKYGFLYQGQYYQWQKQPRGKADFHLPPASMVIFLENHDQVANSGRGKRIQQLSEFGNYKALSVLLLLSPNTPMLFQGQEFGSTKPFYYFADHAGSLGMDVFKGRKKNLSQFPRLATVEMRKIIADPSNPLTFTQCKLDFKERTEHKEVYTLFKDLIALRKNDPVFKDMWKHKIDGAVLNKDSFLIRYFGIDEDRLLIINFGSDHSFNPAPEPLLAPGEGREWKILWSSESTTYGGDGTPPIHIPYWKIVGHSAIVLKNVSRQKKRILDEKSSR